MNLDQIKSDIERVDTDLLEYWKIQNKATTLDLKTVIQEYKELQAKLKRMKLISKLLTFGIYALASLLGIIILLGGAESMDKSKFIQECLILVWVGWLVYVLDRRMRLVALRCFVLSGLLAQLSRDLSKLKPSHRGNLYHDPVTRSTIDKEAIYFAYLTRKGIADWEHRRKAKSCTVSDVSVIIAWITHSQGHFDDTCRVSEQKFGYKVDKQRCMKLADQLIEREAQAVEV